MLVVMEVHVFHAFMFSKYYVRKYEFIYLNSYDTEFEVKDFR
jgi:hypothetical protein